MSSNSAQNVKTSKLPKGSKIPILLTTPQQPKPKPLVRKSSMMQPFIVQKHPIETPQKPVNVVYDDRIRSPPTLLPFGVNLFECSPELRKATLAKLNQFRKDPLHSNL